MWMSEWNNCPETQYVKWLLCIIQAVITQTMTLVHNVTVSISNHSPSMTSFNYLPSRCLSFVMCWTQRLLLLFDFWKCFKSNTITKRCSLTHDRLNRTLINSSRTPHPAALTMDSKSQPVTSPRSDYLLLSFSGKKSRFHLWPLRFSWQVSQSNAR